MNKYKTMDANEAVSMNAYNFSEVCGIYPITPASPMAENIEKMSKENKLNYFDKKVNIVQMQSEAGAIAMVHGALETGTLASTFTASQGLLLMIPSLYKLAGEMLPAVIHVAARSLSTHSLSIFGDHQDIYACRQTGVCMLASSNPEQAYHMSAIAHLSAIEASLPFINFFDGFRTSHEINKIKLMDENKIKKLINVRALEDYKKRAMSLINANTRGTAQNDDIYFQNTEVRNKDYVNAVSIVEKYMHEINKLEKTEYKPFNYYGDKNAEYVIIAMGSVCNTIKETINVLNKLGNKLGLVEVHLYRPFSKDLLLKAVPHTVKTIAVLDRTKEPGSNGEPLYLDVVSSLKDKDINIYGGRYGLSSKDTSPNQIKAVYDYMKEDKLFDNFTIGIVDDVTNLSLKVDKDFKINKNNLEILIYGYGSDGMVSTSKDILKIIGDNTKYNVQGYFQYDSKKSGGVTRSHLRLSEENILSTYYVDSPSLIVVSKDQYMYKYDILDNIRENGTFILNTNLNKEQLYKTLPNKVKYLLAKKNINFYIIDAYKLVNELGLKNKISTCMEVCIFNVINIISKNKINSIMKLQNEKRFKHKGQKIIDINNKVVDASLKELFKIEVDKEWINLKYEDKKNLTFNEKINSLEGDTLPVSAFIDNKNGIFEGGYTKQEKRNIAEQIPCWEKENCIQCNQCVFVCPHAVIRPFLTEEDESVEGLKSILPKDKKYILGISSKDCTGCGLCVNVCPGKMGKKALYMKENDSELEQEKYNYLLNKNKNEEYEAKLLNVKNIGFKMPKFEFSGACAGCGETAYLKNLTQMFNNNLIIANATGCSSIYGASGISTPYSIPWASSLFEDNAEFGLGILTGRNEKRKLVEMYMKDNIKKDKELFNKWLDNKDDYNICLEIQKNINYKKHPYLLEMKEYIVPSSVWVVGGDGFAYDIGFSGIDHILSRDENINVLVLDTEVYSNTGGQSSKSSNIGSIASFASCGKQNYKKDLARIAMSYPHVYVATVNIGYNKEQYLKVLKEASEHNGPSIVIAYSPCIEHGIKRGMEHSLDNAYLATKCGYFPIFRYLPKEEKLVLDSKDIDFNLYEEFLSTENRYSRLKNIDKNISQELLEKQKQWSITRYEYYKKIANNE